MTSLRMVSAARGCWRGSRGSGPRSETWRRRPQDPRPSVQLHPHLSDRCRGKVTKLRESIAHPGIRDEAIEILRGLITGVRVLKDEDGCRVGLQGEAAALVKLGLQPDRAQGETLDPAAVSSAKVAAEAGCGHRLQL